jgi:putative tryptophan/tyrosine transport system substrate-binding protein
MRRRDFLCTLLGATAALPPLAAVAQQPKVPRVGLLLPYVQSEAQAQARVAAFQTSLEERGWVDHRNVALEFRYSEGRLDQLPALVSDLVAANVNVVLTAGTEATGAAQRVGTSVPIVMVAIGDPIAAGFIASLARPGGNITGTSLLATELSAKRVQLLMETIPTLTRLAVLWGPGNASTGQKLQQIQAAAAVLGAEVQSLELRVSGDIEKAFEAAAQSGAGAVMTTEDAIQISHRERVVELANKQGIPVASEFGEFARTGALMSYGPNILDSFRNAASYVDKILKGAKPVDLPVEQPTRFELVINLKTAKALGLTVPPSILARADEVIE